MKELGKLVSVRLRMGVWKTPKTKMLNLQKSGINRQKAYEYKVLYRDAIRKFLFNFHQRPNILLSRKGQIFCRLLQVKDFCPATQ
jgi:hypothetical protein